MEFFKLENGELRSGLRANTQILKMVEKMPIKKIIVPKYRTTPLVNVQVRRSLPSETFRVEFSICCADLHSRIATPTNGIRNACSNFRIFLTLFFFFTFANI